jgi:hypothetical protein
MKNFGVVGAIMNFSYFGFLRRLTLHKYWIQKLCKVERRSRKNVQSRDWNGEGIKRVDYT